MGVDSYDKSDGDSVGVEEIFNYKDLSYTLCFDGKCGEPKFLTTEEALAKFGHISEEVRNKILNHGQKI